VRERVSEKESLHVELKERPPELCQQSVPVVDEYPYLGLVIKPYIDLNDLAKGRALKAQGRYRQCQAFLVDQNVPLGLRGRVLHGVVGSTLLYGSEVWGMHQGRSKHGQAEMDKALLTMVGRKETDSSVSRAALRRELGIPPVYAEAYASKARACVKYPSLRTWISTLTRNPCKQVGGSIVKQAHSMLEKWKRNAKEGQDRGISTAKEARDKVLTSVWEETEEKQKEKCIAVRYYRSCGFDETTWNQIKTIPAGVRGEQVKLGYGLRLLNQCRIRGFWTMQKIAKASKKDSTMRQYLHKCPCCEEGGAETVEHILLRCRRWEDLRNRHMGDLIRRAKESLERVPPEGESTCGVEGEILTLILGGTCRGCRLEAWLPEKATSVKENLQCGLFQVARYLQSIAVDRSVAVRKTACKIGITYRGEPTRRADAEEVGQHRIDVSDRDPVPIVEGEEGTSQTDQLASESTTMGESNPWGTRER